MLVKDAKAIVGGIGNPSKMPGKAYGLPAAACKVGTALRQVKDSVCASCYAFGRGRYAMAPVLAAQYRRLDSLANPLWVEAMVTIIKGRQEWFRWHDSGDLQGSWDLANIVEVARRTPNVKQWLPTREYRMVKDYIANGGMIPANLVIRESAHMVDAPPPVTKRPTSTVVTDGSQTCPARSQDNECGTCRDCWNPNVKNVSYPKH